MAEGTDPLARAAELLVAHQRHDIKGCLCGWAELGWCHARHVAGVLAAAGLLRDPDAAVQYGIGDGSQVMALTATPHPSWRPTHSRLIGPWRPVEDGGNTDD